MKELEVRCSYHRHLQPLLKRSLQFSGLKKVLLIGHRPLNLERDDDELEETCNEVVKYLAENKEEFNGELIPEVKAKQHWDLFRGEEAFL